MSEPSKKVEVEVLDFKLKEVSKDQIDYIPIFTIDGFTELELIEKVIEADVMSHDWPTGHHVTVIVLYGGAGTGKTTLARYIAKKNSAPLVTVDCVSNMTDLDLIGGPIFIEGESKIQLGPIAGAVKAANTHGKCVLIWNEFNALSHKAQMAVNPLFDNQEEVTLAMNGGIHFKVDKNAHLINIITLNPGYAGTTTLQMAVNDRVRCSIPMDNPSIDGEARVLNLTTGLPTEWAKRFANLAHETRESKKRGDLAQAFSTRGLIDFVIDVYKNGLKFAFTAIKHKYAQFNEKHLEVYNGIWRSLDMDHWTVPQWTPISKSGKSPIPAVAVAKPKPKKNLVKAFEDDWVKALEDANKN